MTGMLLVVTLAIPAVAQLDPSGEWAPRFHEDQPERIPGPEIGDYLGLPINDAARLRADTWDASLLTLPEHQCKPHPSDYAWRGPANLRIWKEVDRESQKLVAFHTHISWEAPERTIWMDGRPHPPDYAAHTWQGFSTGKFEGDMLTITTTHLKNGWIRRNGVPRSDRATVTEHLIRHGDFLTVTVIINDPVYLTEPFIRTTDFEYDARQEIAPYPCEAVVEVVRPKGAVPSHLPGKNTFLAEFPATYGLPVEAARGGADTMYPEYRLKLKSMKPAPGRQLSGHGTVGQMMRTAGRHSSCSAAGVLAQQPQNADNIDVHVLPVQGNVYMIVGAGGNITMQAGKEGVLLVDTMYAGLSDKVLAAIRTVSDKPIRYIINTHVHGDHTGGNEKLAKAGSTIAGGNVVGDIGASAAEGATVIAAQQVLDRMSKKDGTTPAAPSAAWPTDTYITD